jgi:Bifunctional DNA primase/polymerase, N-terminal
MSTADSPDSATFLKAVSLIDQGLPCFPCHDDKRPASPHGFRDATRDAEALRELWMRYPGTLIGVPTGEVSGFDVLDIDRRG